MTLGHFMEFNAKQSPFFSEILDFYQTQAEEEVDGDILKHALSPNSCDPPLSVAEVIENYQHLFGAMGPVQIEKVLMQAFPVKDFNELGLARYYPRMYRGLPRLYNRKVAHQSHIKINFTHLPSLKRQAATKAVFSLYGNYAPKGKMAIFTWVVQGGFSNLIAASTVVRMLKYRFPEMDIHLVTVENLPISDEIQSFLRSCDFVLQMPTFYPNTADLKIQKMEHVGEYGFLESSWFHPKSGNYSMGLHFLEKGIMTRKINPVSWSEVQNKELCSWRRAENHFYLAYLSTTTGGATYLHALLKSLEFDAKGIDLCVPDLKWLIQFIEKQHRKGKPILAWDLGIESIEICYQGKVSVLSISPSGKRLRILCPEKLSHADFQALLTLSGEFVAVGGNQSLTEALSLGKGFFYDGRQYARYFIKDLLALAENRIGTFRSTLTCIRGMNQCFLHNLPEQEEEWVDETFFQEKEDWTSIALQIGLALQDPSTIVGFQKLGQIVRTEFSCNAFLCHLVQRAFCHLDHPHIGEWEQDLIAQFASGQIPFSSLIKTFNLKLSRGIEK